MAKPCQP